MTLWIFSLKNWHYLVLYKLSAHVEIEHYRVGDLYVVWRN